MLKKLNRDAKGFTITEFMIATAVTGFFVLLGAAVINQVTRFEKDMAVRLMDDFLIVNSHKVLVRDLEGTYWSRLGHFNCGASQPVLTTVGDTTLNLEEDGSSFEFVTVDTASTVGLAPVADTIVVADARNLRPGDYVMLNLAASMTEAGLFKVKTVDVATSQVQVGSAMLDEQGSSCHDTLTAKSLNSFFGPNIKSNVLLSRIIAVKYKLDGGLLTRQVWPGGNSAEEVIDGVKKVIINGKWNPITDDSEGKKIYGRMNYKVTFDVEQKTMVSNAATYFKDKVIESQYTLNVFQIANVYTPVGAPSAAMSFPTCSINQEFKAGVINVNPSLELYRNTISLKLSGSVSESVSGATMNVAFSPSAGSTILCFQHDPEDGTYPTNGTVNGPGISGSITLNQGVSGFDVYTCAVKGSIEVTASMSYFDSNLNQVKTINCTAESIKAPKTYRFSKNQNPTCKKWGDVKLGSNFSGDDVNVFYGRFGLDQNKSCEWTGETYTDAVNTGVAGSCRWWEHMAAPFVPRTLKRIYLRPYRMDVKSSDGGGSVFSATGAYVDCGS